MPPLVTNQPSHWRSWAAERVRDATVAMSPGTELENKGGGGLSIQIFRGGWTGFGRRITERRQQDSLSCHCRLCLKQTRGETLSLTTKTCRTLAQEASLLTRTTPEPQDAPSGVD